MSPATHNSTHDHLPRVDRLQRLSLLKDLKLLFAALGAGGRVVPLGDNSRTAHLLAQYAATLRGH
jgi:hypothetical protein